MRSNLRWAITACALGLAAPMYAAPDGAAPAATAAPHASARPTAAPALALSGAGLHTTDIERALRFYQDGLGMVELRRLKTAELEEAILGFGAGSTSPSILLLKPRAAAPVAVSTADHQNKIVLEVADAEALAARLKAAGFKPGPINYNATHGVKVFWVSDPDGHRFEIVQRTRSTS